MMRARFFLTGVLLVTLASRATGQGQDPVKERGFDPQKAFVLDDVGVVNLFNGNLNIPLPIGLEYPVGGKLSYQLALHYGGNSWGQAIYEDFVRDEDGNPVVTLDGSGNSVTTIQEWSHAYPVSGNNAGIGWRLTLGRQLPPDTCAKTGGTLAFETQDGATHCFYTSLHADRVEAPSADLMYTRDGSYLRYNKTTRTVTTSDGVVYTLGSLEAPDYGGVTRIADAVGNWITIDYDDPGAPSPAFAAETNAPYVVWHISDSHDRHHYVYLVAAPSHYEAFPGAGENEAPEPPVDHFAVREIHLESHGGESAVWTLEYETTPEGGWPAIARACAPYAPEFQFLPKTVVVPLLSQVRQPDGSRLSLQYEKAPGSHCEASGILRRMTLPTGGAFEWQYDTVFYQPYRGGNIKNPVTASFSTAVVRRIAADSDGSRLGVRAFVHESDPVGSPPNFPSARQKKVTVTDYGRTDAEVLRKSAHFFTTCAFECADGDRRGEYGLPLTHVRSSISEPSGAEWGLSEITYGGNAFADVLGKRFVAYEADIDLSAAPVEHTDFNRRQFKSRLYDEMGNCSEERLSRFDGLGHYRVATKGDCSGSPVETTTTTYNEAHAGFIGSRLAIPDWPWPAATLVPEALHWNRYSSRTATTSPAPAGSSSRYLQTVFDDSGLLTCKRIVANSAPGPNDVVACYEYADGNVTREEYLGGDDTPLKCAPSGCSAEDLATIAASPRSPRYRIDHTYAWGARATSTHWDRTDGKAFTFLELDRTIDRSTGLPIDQRDITGKVATIAKYDPLGRLVWSEPTGGPPTRYQYAPGERTVKASQYAVGTTEDAARTAVPVTQLVYEYDGLGRIVTERRRMPAGVLATKVTTRNALGWPVTIQEFGAGAGEHTALTYDGLGRVVEVTAPDGSKSGSEYQGRTVTRYRIEAALPATRRRHRVEQSDALGRLVAVTERPDGTKSDSTSDIATTYEYDAGGQIAKVHMTAPPRPGETPISQTRAFMYDGREVLMREQHPELESAIDYEYDARGHATRKRQGDKTLVFAYDDAERLRAITADDRVIKSFTFGDDNFGVDWRRGKLTAARRRNELSDGRSVEVTETYEYSSDRLLNPAGQLSKRTTTVETVSGQQRATLQQFVQAIPEYDSLALPRQVTMPTCVFQPCTAGKIGSQTFIRDTGYLTRIETAGEPVGILNYHASGALEHVTHHPSDGSATDTYTPDRGIARPKTIRFSSCATTPPVVITEPAICSGTPSSASTAEVPNATYAWSISGGSITSAQGRAIEFRPDGGGPVQLRVSVTSACGTYSSDAVEVTLAPAGISTPTITAPAEMCPGTTGSASVAPMPGYVYRWTVAGDGWKINGREGAVGYGASAQLTAGTGQGVVSLTISNACGETRTVAQVIAQSTGCEWPCALTWAVPLDSSYFIVNPNEQREVTVKAELARPPGVAGDLPYEKLTFDFEWYQDGISQQTNQMVSTTLSGPWIGESKFILRFVDQTHISVVANLTCRPKLEEGQREDDRKPDRSATVRSDAFGEVNGHCVTPHFEVESTAVRLAAATAELVANVPYTAASLQWYRGETGNVLWPISGATTSKLSVSSPGTFWLRATMACGSSVDSPTIVVSSSTCSPVRIITDPQNMGVAAGGSATLTVAASGSPVPTGYGWMAGPYPVPQGNGGPSMVINDIKETAEYWVEVSNGCSTSSSRPARVQVISCADINILVQPPDTFVGANDALVLKISAQGYALTYEWYAGSSGDTSRRIMGATTSTLNVAPGSIEDRYWVRVRHPSSCAVDSRTVNVCRAPRIQNALGADYVNALPKVRRVLSVGASGTSLKYEWYEGDTSDTSRPLASKSNAVAVWPLETTRYWVRVSSECHPSVVVAATRVSVPPEIRSVSGSDVVTRDSTRVLSVTAAGKELSYQWFRRDAAGAVPIQNATGSSYTTPPVASDVTYFCRVSSGTAPVDTSDITLTVLKPKSPSIANYPAAVSGALAVLEVLSPSPDEMYEWYEGASGATARPLGGGTQVSVRPLATTTYWVRTLRALATADSLAITVRVCNPAITVQPEPVTVVYGGQATLTVTATGTPPLTYTWYRGSAGDTSTQVATGSSSTYTTPASLSTTTEYWVRVASSDSACSTSSAYSLAATVTICHPAKITRHPGDVVVGASGTTLAVEASGTDLTYQWYAGDRGVVTTPAGDISSSPTQTVNPAVSTRYWVRVRGACSAAEDSNAAMVSVAPTITAQPAGGPITSGSTRTLVVGAAGTQLSYQWYRRVAGTAESVSGATLSSYTTPAIYADTTYFCRIRSAAAYRDSADATLTVCQPRQINMVGYHNGISGSVANLQVNDAAAGESFEWYQGNSGQTNVRLGTGTTLAVRPAVTTSYWVRTKRAGCDADSAAITVKICVPLIQEQPASSAAYIGQQAMMSVSAVGTLPLAYQWYEGPSGDTTRPVSGATSAAFTTPALSTSTEYWVRVTSPADGCSRSYTDSAAAAITVCNPTKITAQPRDLNTTATWVTLTVDAEGDDLQYQWYRGASGDESAPIGDDTCTLTFVASATDSYWVRVTGTCGVVHSATALVSVIPKITQQPASTSVCGVGDSAVFNIAATGAQGYRWYRRVPGGVAEMAGTGSPFATPVPAADTAYWAEAWSGNAVAQSNAVKAAVTGYPTLYSFSAASYYTNQYTLTAAVPAGQRSSVGYRFYRGAIGDMTALLADSATNYKTVTPPYRPITYWVRVYYLSSPARCFADGSVTIP